MTNDNLFFATEDKQIAKLYAPFEFIESRAIHHLDEDKYKSKRNRLMTPDFRRGVPTHQIGPIVEEIQKILRDKSSKRPHLCDSSAVPAEPEAPISVGLIAVISGSVVFAVALVFLIRYFLKKRSNRGWLS